MNATTLPFASTSVIITSIFIPPPDVVVEYDPTVYPLPGFMLVSIFTFVLDVTTCDAVADCTDPVKDPPKS